MSSNVNKKVVLFIATLGAFLTPFMSSSVVVALPAIDKEFATNAFVLSWVASSFLLTSAVFVIPFGRAADIFGRKRIYLFGIALFTISSILCGLSTSSVMLIIFRVIQGIGGAAIFGTSIAILTAVFSPGKRGKAIGINVAVTYLGLSVGPFLGGFLTEHFGWRSIFYVNVPIGAAVIVMALIGIKHEWAEAKGESFDFIGSIIYGIGLLSIMVGISFIRSAWWGPLLLIFGVLTIITFGLFEKKVKNPLLNLGLFRNNKILVFSSLAALISYSATYAVGYNLSLYLQYVKGFGPQHAGIVLIAQPAVQALLSPLAGRFSDKIQPQKLASIGMAITAVGLVVLVFLRSNSSVLLVITGLIILGFGFALFSSPNTNAIMSSVENRFYGVTSGVLGTARLMGQTFSIGISSLIFAIYMGQAQINREYQPHFMASFRIIFIVLSTLCVLGIFASLARGRVGKAIKN